MDFSCFKPPEDLKISRKAFIEHLKKSGELNEESLQVQVKAMESSGIGDHTYLPSSVILANPPVDNCMKEARCEAEMVMFAVMDELFEKTLLLVQNHWNNCDSCRFLHEVHIK